MGWLSKLFKKKRDGVEENKEVKVPEIQKRAKVEGIDIYHGDVISDWSKLATSIDFVYMKCTEGDNFSDPAFNINRDMANKMGIPCGHYHFYRSNKSPEEQALDFINRVKELRVGELPPIIDWETDDDPKDGTDENEVKKFANILEEKFKVVPWIYGGPYFLKNKKLHDSFSRYPLLVAHYKTDKPMIPSPWTSYLIWQDSDKAIVSGMKKRCDHNFFNGTIEDLNKFRRK